MLIHITLIYSYLVLYNLHFYEYDVPLSRFPAGRHLSESNFLNIINSVAGSSSIHAYICMYE